MRTKWTQQDIPDLTGKVIVVTGANSGLGFECSKIFAAKGAAVVMTARNMEKGERARADILQDQPNAWMYNISKLFMAQDISMGVLPMLYGCTAEEAKGGVFYGPNTFNMRGYPAEKKANKEAYDSDSRKRFWKVSEELAGVTYSFSKAQQTLGQVSK